MAGDGARQSGKLGERFNSWGRSSSWLHAHQSSGFPGADGVSQIRLSQRSRGGLATRARKPLPKLSLTQFAGGFEQPVHITHAGDGSDRLFVVSQAGQIQIVRHGNVLKRPFLDIRNRVLTGGEQGLFSVAFSPDYSKNRQFYVYYTNLAGNLVIARYRTTRRNPNVANPNSERIVLTIDHPTYTNHNGGQLAFGPDGFLYIGTGDGGGSGDPAQNAQNPLSLLGKLLRIDVESRQTTPYAIPRSNPFATTEPAFTPLRGEIWALGLRNPWRFSFDRKTGHLYLADVGQSGFEEVNFQPAASLGGQNYGWSMFEGNQPYQNAPMDTTRFTFPVAGYDHSQGSSITGGSVYRGTAEPKLKGAYLFGDFINGKIWGLRRNGATWRQKLLLDSPYGISSFGDDEQGNLYVADYFEGNVYQVTTKSGKRK